MIVEVGAGFWVVTLRCHGEDCSVTVASLTLATVWAALETLLASGMAPWRPYETWKGKDRKAKSPKKG